MVNLVGFTIEINHDIWPIEALFS